MYSFIVSQMDTVEILPQIPEHELQKLYEIMSSFSVPKTGVQSNRRGFEPGHRAMTLGIIKQRRGGLVTLSYYSKKYPLLLEELSRLATLLNFQHTSIHVNHNVKCPPHVDSNIVGESLIFSIGDYTGGDLKICEKAYNIRHTPVIFDGSKLVHYTTDFVGNRYSFVFYSIKETPLA